MPFTSPLLQASNQLGNSFNQWAPTLQLFQQLANSSGCLEALNTLEIQGRLKKQSNALGQLNCTGFESLIASSLLNQISAKEVAAISSLALPNKVGAAKLLSTVSEPPLKNKKRKRTEGGSEDSLSKQRNSHYRRSKFRGVYYNCETKLYRARIHNQNKSEHLGNFEQEIEAAKAYDARAKELNRKHLNFP